MRKVMKDEKKAIEILNQAIKIDVSNHLLYLQLIDIAYQQDVICVDKIISLFDQSIETANNQLDKQIMVNRKIEFIQDFGGNAAWWD